MKISFKTYFLVVFVLMFTSFLKSQTITQVVRGVVLDEESQLPLIGVNVIIPSDGDIMLGASTDIDGKFRIEEVPLGRQSIEFSYLGYESIFLADIIVSSAKEVILHLSMVESATELATVQVFATKQQGDVRNEMATVSARQFSVEETDRYAGSRGEPARMASNFAGVQGADDSRNDIIIRGNSPGSVLWRLEGINIPNPNHFSIPGTGGGPVTILNNKFLANSDFFTGAFPAEYANSNAGVFDLRMRNGNNEKQELSAQFGFLGTDIMAEGPLKKENGSSYLAMFRYSTLDLFNFLGIQIGTDAVPKYYDGAFKLNFPLANNGNLSVWGIGGNSTVDIILSADEAPDTTTLIFGDNDRDQYFTSHMFTSGLTYTQPVGTEAFIKAGVAASQSQVVAHHDYIYRRTVNDQFVLDSLPPILDYTFRETKYSSYIFLNQKFSRKLSLKTGLQLDMFRFFYRDSTRVRNPEDGTLSQDWRLRWNSKESAALVQPYVNVKYRVNNRLHLTAGLTALYFSLNDNSFSPLEPRLGAVYKQGQGRFSLGVGLHSQTQSPYLYFYGDKTINGQPVANNQDMGLSKSWHSVLGYERLIGKAFRIKTEVYYQHLFEIPVEDTISSFSLANAGTGFERFFPNRLINEGTGRNYGFELTLEKFFSRGYYFLVTGSFYDAKYRGSDEVLRNITFNGRYTVNTLFAKEFTFKNGTALNVGGKYTRAGGRWYGKVDEMASDREQEIVFEDTSVNTRQFPDYVRFDIRTAFRWNRSKVTHEWAVDLVNVLDRQNILSLTYAPDNPLGPIREEYQLGFLPVFYYKIDF